jgi:hypothetical protein
VVGGFREVVLHHIDDIRQTDGGRLALQTQGVRLERIDPVSLLSAVPEVGGGLVSLYLRLSQPAARSNILRAAILARHGGVYLDTDILCLRPFAPLLTAGALCGQERIVLPARVVRSRRPSTWFAAGARLLAREICRQAPAGYRFFSKIERFYPLAVNNAVLGAEPEHPFVRGLLQRMVRVPFKEQERRFRLGTHLLEDAVAQACPGEVEVHPPSRFYPLAPEISHHYFRLWPRLNASSIIPNDTVLAHWYASVRTKDLAPKINAEYVRLHADKQLFSQLALPSL